jgi:saxitoxin biosynthesis operon SxtJ-like protein
MLPINRNPSAKDLRSFARIWFPLFVAFLGGMIWWRANQPTAAMVVWGVGAAVEVAVLASQAVARQVFVGLMIVTYPIGLVVSTVALALLFYLVFTPLGWAMRLSGRDPLRLKTRTDRSEWHAVAQNDDPQQMFRQF